MLDKTPHHQQNPIKTKVIVMLMAYNTNCTLLCPNMTQEGGRGEREKTHVSPLILTRTAPHTRTHSHNEILKRQRQKQEATGLKWDC